MKTKEISTCHCHCNDGNVVTYVNVYTAMIMPCVDVLFFTQRNEMSSRLSSHCVSSFCRLVSSIFVFACLIHSSCVVSCSASTLISLIDVDVETGHIFNVTNATISINYLSCRATQQGSL